MKPASVVCEITDLHEVQTRILLDVGAGASAQRIAAELCEAIRQRGASRAACMLQIGPDGRLHLLASAGGPPGLIAVLEGLPSEVYLGAGAHSLPDTAPVLIRDAQFEHNWGGEGGRALAATHGIRSWWSQPVWVEQQPAGTFVVIGSVTGLPDGAGVRLLQFAAMVAGSILRLHSLENNVAAQREERERQQTHLQRLISFQAMLAQVNQLAAGRPDMNSLFEGVCRIAVDQGGLRLAWIGAPDNTGVFRPAAAAGVAGFLDAILVSTDPNRPEGRGLSGTAWREGRSVVRQKFNAATMSPDRWKAAQRFGLGAGAALPLKVRGLPQAVLHVYAAEEGVLDAALMALLEELALEVGRALEAIAQQRHLDHLQALHSTLMTLGEALLLARSDAEMLNRTCSELAHSALFRVAWVGQPDTNDVMRPLASAGLGIDQLAAGPFTLADEPPSLVVRCWRDAQTVVSNDMLADPNLARYRHLAEAGAWRSAAVLPVQRGGARFAVLALGSPQPDLFTRDVLAVCERVAALLGRGLDEFDLKQTLERERRRQFHLARHDALTNLPNRRQFNEQLDQILVDARRRGAPVAVCMLDFDDFKPVNDRYGHSAGDVLLRHAAQRLRDALRRSDLIARLGGDEFALALDDLPSVTSLPGLLQRVAEAFAMPFDLGDDVKSVQVDASVGVAVFPDDGDTPDLLLRRADVALYAAKAAKGGRPYNWQRWSEDLGVPAAPQVDIDDPYGLVAQQLLAQTAALWPSIADDFVEDFYTSLAHHTLAAPVLAALSPDELIHLKGRQAAHLIAMMHPEMDPDTTRRTAQAIGRVHALTGVDDVVMLQTIGLYQTHLGRHLSTQSLRANERRDLMAIATARLREDSAAQMESRANTVGAYFDVLSHRLDFADVPWTDALQGWLDAIAALPGILSARLVRPDMAGTFQTTASSSIAGLPFGGLVGDSGWMPSTDRTLPEGYSLLSLGWHGNTVISTSNYQTDPRTAPWHGLARQFGVRSAVALPIQDRDSRPVAMLMLFGAFPNQFESLWIRHVCSGLKQELSWLWHRHHVVAAAALVPEQAAASWRRRLFTGGLQIHYQPIVDLQEGKPVKVEALARLVLEDGQVILPGQFMPILGMRDLDELFRLGLTDALKQISRWDAEGLALDVSINLAPSTLMQPNCVLWIRDALQQVRIAPGRLSLEITEEQAFSAADTASTALSALSPLGVNVVMDDLGAGYGSLNRLRNLPFRAAKIDQSLIKDVRVAPVQSISFAGALIQLGRDLEIEVMVEGLESEDLVEAAAVLGANAGQGFALGQPMPAEAITSWARKFVWRVDRHAPQTTLGAMAMVWVASHRCGPHLKPVEDCPITRFLERRGQIGGSLDAAHRALHRLVASEGRFGRLYRRAIKQFLHDLADSLIASA